MLKNLGEVSYRDDIFKKGGSSPDCDYQVQRVTRTSAPSLNQQLQGQHSHQLEIEEAYDNWEQTTATFDEI